MFFFWNFQTVTVLMQGTKTMIFWSNIRLQVLCFRLRLWWIILKKWELRNKSLNIGWNQNKEHFLEYLECHESDAWIETKKNVNCINFRTRRIFDGYFVWRNHTYIFWKFGFEYRDKSAASNFFFEVSGYRYYEGGIKNIGFSIKSSSTNNVRLSMERAWWRNNAYSCREMCVEISIKVNINSTFFIFMFIKSVIRGIKSILVLLNSSPRIKSIRLKPGLEN